MPTRLTVLASALAACLAGPAHGEDALPEFAEVREIVVARLTGGKGDFPNRLLTRGDVAPVLVAIDELGWSVPDEKALLERFLPDGDALVRELRKPRDTEFAKAIAKLPDVYDRLDRLRRMPYGMRRIREFATTPGGSKMLEYMTTTKAGARLERQIGRGTDGRGFDQPTGRLYTADDLIDELQRLYDERTDEGTPPATGRTSTSRPGTLAPGER